MKAELCDICGNQIEKGATRGMLGTQGKVVNRNDGA